MSEAIYVEPNDRYEIIEGVKYMAAAAAYDHNVVTGRLFAIFDNYFRKDKIGMVVQDADVCLSEENTFRPDLSVVCDFSKLGADKKIHGAPDLVVEVLSPSTAKRDFTKKREIYARNGVKEYWIVDWVAKNIFVHKLVDGNYELDDVYHDYTADELSALEPNERAKVRKTIKVSIVPNLSVNIHRVFETWWNVH